MRYDAIKQISYLEMPESITQMTGVLLLRTNLDIIEYLFDD
jgi:hypothetical protein